MHYSKIIIVLAALSGGIAVSSAKENPLERGRYLVENIGMCADCHSPRGEKGLFVAGREFTGSPLGFTPTVPMPVWADTAPLIAGLPNYTTEQAVKFLMTGERPTGIPVRPPMPAYRMGKEDAEAIVTYLKSIKPKL